MVEVISGWDLMQVDTTSILFSKNSLRICPLAAEGIVGYKNLITTGNYAFVSG